MDQLRQHIRSYNRWKLERSWGSRIRTRIDRFGKVVLPYIRKVIPNFRAAHYVYIISWLIFGTFLVYPAKNMAYIDVLFLTTGASTQAGLNTVDGNSLLLYQQIIVYIITTLTTPIFIHGSILFVRLYAFERHFDGIKASSKLNYKMRRSATLAARTRSFDSTLINTVNNQGLGFGVLDPATQVNTNLNSGLATQMPTRATKDDIDGDANVEQISPPTSTSYVDESGKTYHVSEPSDSDSPGPRIAPDDIEIDSESNNEVDEEAEHDKEKSHPDNEGIRFGNLPQPSKLRRAHDVNPSDMYMSISMLLKKHKNDKTHTKDHNRDGNGDGVDDDEVLVIRPPNEIENDKNPIFRTKGKYRKKNWRKKKWNNLKKSFSNTGGTYNHKAAYDASHHHEDDQDHDGDDEHEGEHNSEEEEEEERGPVDENSTHTNPNKNKNLTIEINQNDSSNAGPLGRSPTFERLLRHKLNRKNNSKISGRSSTNSARPSMNRRLRRYSSIALATDDDEGSFDSENSDDNDDEEEDIDAILSDSDLNYTNTNQHNDINSLGRVVSKNYLSWEPTIGRNSTFVYLSDQQKEELGGVEYRAVKLLIKVIIVYYVGWHLIAMLLLLPYILSRPHYETSLRAFGILPTWWAFFTAQSSFNDLGLTLTPDSMITFQRSIFVLIVVSYFVVIGNTGFPIMLRFLIWILYKCAKPLLLFKESLEFLLDHPRRCFTLLFPSVPTWWLFFILVVLNGIDLVLFIILDLHSDYLLVIPVGNRILDGLFQAFSTRTAGFAVVDLSQLHPAVQVSYMLMMYISVLPLAISIRRTNVYEEQSLGVYLKADHPRENLAGAEAGGDGESGSSESKNSGDEERTPQSFIGAHLRNQLSFDLWFIFLGLFIICIAEGGRLNSEPLNFSIFKILFEIISAYGTVGLSLGYSGINASFLAEFSTISKLVIIAMMIRGRHRGLPYSLDRAIMLPDDNMEKIDAVQEHHAIRRNQTSENHHTSAFDDIPLRRVFTRRPSNLGFDRRKRGSMSSETGFHFPRTNTTQDRLPRQNTNQERLARHHTTQDVGRQQPVESHEMNTLRPMPTT